MSRVSCTITSPPDCHSGHGNLGPGGCPREKRDKDRWRHIVINNISCGVFSLLEDGYVCVLFVWDFCISLIYTSL